MGQALNRAGGRRLRAPWRRWTFLSFFLLVVLSNAVGSYFNITYNLQLIVRRYLSEAQEQAFWKVLYAYNALAYAVCFGLVTWFLLPLARCRRELAAGRDVSPARLERCRKLLINLPFYQVLLNLLGWLPGAVVFPLGICLLGGWENAGTIHLQFAVSFVISALLTTIQTFFLLEAFLIDVLYPEFFRDQRPAQVSGALQVSLGWRVGLLWTAVALVPLLALLAVVLNFDERMKGDFGALRRLALGVSLVGLPVSGFLMWMMGRNLLSWVRAHSQATREVAAGNFRARVGELRPDEWGRLTDRFNDMAAALERGEQLRETFGQFVSPEVRDEILEKHPDLGGKVQELTVLFADLRGFTRRTAGVAPEAAVDLLNRFLSLAVLAVEENGGWVNKFLGDGILALFGAPRACEDHADLALAAALELHAGLDRLNEDLRREGQEELGVGIGIHTGPALVGCIGASLTGPDGGRRVRREFTAIGETVNLAQRLEELTKVHGGPILVSDDTVRRLRRSAPLERLGPVSVLGYAEPVVVHRK